MADLPESPPPFRCLGYLSGVYHYYSRGEQAVVAMQAGGHGKKALYRLAPHSYWVDKYPGKKDDFDENSAASALMGVCQTMGIFSISRVRGRGVWMDKGQPVIHYGDKVNIEGKDYKPFLTPGKFVYELAEPLGFEKCESLSSENGLIFTNIMQQLRWETPEQYMWFCGWLVCALIGGALPWRPHIWLTGGAQSGKTTLSGIIKKILRNNCLYIKSVSTEAGIRQTLKADCLSVVMDEAEREDSISHSRIQSILTLARQASSDDDSKIVKGTPSGTALNFQIRSPFCLSSINSALIQTADKGRFTNIELSTNKLSGDNYKIWKENIDNLLTEQYVQQIYQRIFSLVPIIVSNARELSNAIEAKTNDKRLGDQYGALLAGFKILSNDALIDSEDAKWAIEDINFANEKENANGINDQHGLLNKIMQHVMRIPKDRGFEELPIAEMCLRVHKSRDFNNESKIVLSNIGIKILIQGIDAVPSIAIANDNDNLAEILKGSRWPHNWQQTLKRLPFAKPSENIIYFSSGCRCRAVIFPIECVIFEEPDDKPLLSLIQQT